MMHRSKMKDQVLVIKTNGKYYWTGREETLWVRMKMSRPLLHKTNMSPKHRLLEVEREQGAHRKSFQVGRHLSLEKKEK